jgi:hypothetical protein
VRHGTRARHRRRPGRQILIKTGPATFKIPDGPPQPSKLAVRPEDVLDFLQLLGNSPESVSNSLRRVSETRTVQRRLRDLPSRVGVYFLLATCMFPEVGYGLVWAKLTAGLSGMPVVRPSTKALRDLRRRLGSAPVRALFEVLAGPLARPTMPGVRFGPYRTVSFDGCSSIKVPDSERNRGWLGRCPHGGYPQIELMTLVETGTRAVIAAVFGPTREGETSYATRLLHHLGPEMLVLWDRGFGSNDFLTAAHATGAQVLGRIRQRRRPPVT